MALSLTAKARRPSSPSFRKARLHSHVRRYSHTLTLSAGKGGNGVIAWRREKFIPKGRPCRRRRRQWRLYLSRSPSPSSLSRRLPQPPHSQSSKWRRRRRPTIAPGKTGQDLYLKIPLGTLVKNASTKRSSLRFHQSGPNMENLPGRPRRQRKQPL